MANPSTLQVLIDIKAELSGLTQAVAQMNQLKAATQATAAAAGEGGFAKLFEIGESIDLVRRLNDVVAEIPSKLKEWITQGVEFNAELQKTQTSIAGLFRQEAPLQFINFEAAKAAAGNTVDLLKSKANELGVAYSDMFEAFEHAQAQMATGGIKNIQDEINLIAILNRAMQSLGVSSQQASRDIGDILQGQASRTLGGGRLAAAMGLGKEELDQNIQEWKQAGNLYQELAQRLSGFQEAGRAASQNFNADMARMQNAIFDLKAAAAEPIMQPLTEAINELTRALQSADAKSLSSDLGKLIKEFAEDAFLAAAGWKAIAIAIVEADRALLNALPGARLFASLMQSVPGAKVLSPAAPGGDTFDLREFLESNLNKEREKGIVPLRLQVAAQKESAKTTEEIKKLENDIALKRAEASGDTEAIAQRHAAVAYEQTLAAAKEKLIPQAQAIKLAEQERDATLAVWRARADAKGAHQAHRDIQQQITELTRQEAATLEEIRGRQQIIAQNPFASPDQKNAQIAPLIQQEIAALNSEVDKGRALLSGTALDPAQYQQVDAEVKKAAREIELLSQKAQTLTFGGGIRAELGAWVSSFGTAAHQIGQAITSSINTALDATANALTDVIFRTGNWRQTMLQAEKQIISSLIKIGLQMLVQWAVSKFIRDDNTRGQVQAGAQIAAAHAPAAAATSISSFGSAAVIGAIAAAAAIALIIGLLAGGGFEGGGYTGALPRKRIAGVVHGDEFVHDSPTTNLYGRDFHQALLEHKIPVAQARALLGNYRYTPITPRFGSFEVGGAVAAIESSSNNGGPSFASATNKSTVVNQALFLDRDEARKWLIQQPEGERAIIDLIRGNKHIIGGFRS